MASPKPLFSADFYTDIVHEMDPEQDVAPEALAEFNELARDFVLNVLCTASRIARGAGGREITAENIHFVLQNYFGMTLSGPSGPQRSVAQEPTAEYHEKIVAVRDAAASGRYE
jgi:hypothetical protein